MPQFKAKCTWATVETVEAENMVEARGVIKGYARAKLPMFVLERIEFVKADVPKILPKGKITDASKGSDE